MHIDEIIPRLNSINKPLIILVGSKSTGKTVTLLRLAKFLKKNGNFKVLPNEDFRTDNDYPEACEKFQELLNSRDYAPDPTAPINFLLVDIYKDNKLIYHILEAPGEHFFSDQNPYDNSNRAYFASLFSKDIQKILVFIFEKNMLKDDAMQSAYSDRLSSFVSMIKPKNNDRLIFMLNKVDKMPVQQKGTVDEAEVKKYIYDNENYNSLKNAILNVKGLDPVKFIPFSNGTFSDIGDDKQSWVLSNDDYPSKLWSLIIKKYTSIFGFKF